MLEFGSTMNTMSIGKYQLIVYYFRDMLTQAELRLLCMNSTQITS